MPPKLMTVMRLESIESLEPLVLMSASGFGTDGNDLLLTSTAGEAISGGDGNDILIGIGGDNSLSGGNGHDLLIPTRGNNLLDGGSGNDLVVFMNSHRSDFVAVRHDDGATVLHHVKGQLELRDVESVRFLDGEFSIEELFGANAPAAAEESVSSSGLDDSIDDSIGQGPIAEYETPEYEEAEGYEEAEIESPSPVHEYRTIDGTLNNLEKPELGSSGEVLIRLGSVEYTDGANQSITTEERPSARVISNSIAAQTTTETNDRGMTDFVWLWGQFLDHDLDLSGPADPSESYDIEVPTGDAQFDPLGTGEVTIGLTRSRYETDPDTGVREQINEITAYLDGSNVYGSDELRAAALRTFERGMLKTSEGNLLPINTDELGNANSSGDLFLAGDVRANENVTLTSMHTLWVREHNRIATELSDTQPWLDDQQLYQQAREIVIAELQIITYKEFLPALLGENSLEEYSGYKSDVDPSIANEFSTAAYRIGHTLLSAELQRQNNDGSQSDEGDLALRDAFFSPDEVTSHGIDSLLKGISLQAANEVDNQIVDDVRNSLFGAPGAGGFDLASLNIQRGRDHGLPDYNQMRVDLGLTAVCDFADITSNVDVQNKLRDLYGSVDNIDLWVGGLAEDHVSGGSVGETFRTILIDQFTRLRDADRFWYQNVFDADKIEQLESTTLSDVIERNSGVRNLQDNVFFIAEAMAADSETDVDSPGDSSHEDNSHSHEYSASREHSSKSVSRHVGSGSEDLAEHGEIDRRDRDREGDGEHNRHLRDRHSSGHKSSTHQSSDGAGRRTC